MLDTADRGICAGRYRRRGDRFVRRGAAGRDGGSREPCAHRAGQDRIHGQPGPYNIIDLRPGTYVVTFALPGFSTVRREGVSLSAAFTATVDASMAVGAVEQMITVTGAAPLVDIQRTASGATVPNELLESVPTTRMVQRLTAFLPGVQQFQAGPSSNLGADSAILSVNGSRGGESNVQLEGITTRHMGGPGGSGGVRLVINQAMVQETHVSLGSAGAEQQMGAVMTNVVPKQGGNTFSGMTYFHYTNESFSGDNLPAALKATSFSAAGQIRESWDINPAIGGPIIRDRLWFYGSYRHWGDEVDGGVYYNLTPTAWGYMPDLKPEDRGHEIQLPKRVAPPDGATVAQESAQLLLRQQPALVVQPANRHERVAEAATYTPYYRATSRLSAGSLRSAAASTWKSTRSTGARTTSSSRTTICRTARIPKASLPPPSRQPGCSSAPRTASATRARGGISGWPGRPGTSPAATR